MLGAFKQLANRRLLNGLARIHHDHPISDARYNTQVVAYI